MKGCFKYLGLIVTIGIFVALAVAGYVRFSDIPSYENKALDLSIDGDSALIAEGARMASMMCANCHRSKDGKLGGNYMADAQSFGEIYASNITQHPDYGIADYTDGELVYLLRTGIKKNGQYSPPYMPKYPNLSDQDINALIAFLRSDHPLVQPSDNQPPECKPSYIAKILSRIAWKPLPYPEKEIFAPPASDEVAFGKYISTAKFDCYACHSGSFETMDVMVPENSAGYFGGGNEMFDLDGNTILSPNLTMDELSGIGNWTKDQFIRMVKTGVKPDGSSVSYPMTPYPAMTDEEISAIWEYLLQVPVISNPKLMSSK